MWIYSIISQQPSAESLYILLYKMLVCSSLIPFNNSWTLWGPRRPLTTDRVFRNVGSWSSVLLFSVILRADVSNIVMMPLCVLDLASRGYRSCSHLTDSTSPSPFTYPSAFCASYSVRVRDWFHRSKGVICRISIDWCAEMLFKQIALQDPQALMSPRPCILPITNSSNGRSHQCTSLRSL